MKESPDDSHAFSQLHRDFYRTRSNPARSISHLNANCPFAVNKRKYRVRPCSYCGVAFEFNGYIINSRESNCKFGAALR